MATDRNDKVVVRRDVLKAIGLGAAGAAAAAPLVVAGPAVAKETAEEQVKARYQETDHVKTYYRTNRY
ncbi:twin-arginine translocation signal domain-containing protein [Indioceanicola profundi]|uniref:twin-arginine translocation signal domain-containing protein n=1 Tax=Indioceanicola profundi TaxID=2220096 RepID=UPI000E6AE2EC|nr:twin-arginine translocation signal domain-containing protein [Indioceanicola profundi]